MKKLSIIKFAALFTNGVIDYDLTKKSVDSISKESFLAQHFSYLLKAKSTLLYFTSKIKVNHFYYKITKYKFTLKVALL